YLPPTMAPVPASTRPGLLEHPAGALDAYRRAGVTRVICEEKHMGSRAIVIACRTPEAARDWFGSDRAGIGYTRTGRRFFADAAMEEHLLARVTGALEKAGLWAGLGDWAALDCEIMPWSYKAGELVRGQYAAVGAAALAGLAAAARVCEDALGRGADVAALGERTGGRLPGAPAPSAPPPAPALAGGSPGRARGRALPRAPPRGGTRPRRRHPRHKDAGRRPGGGRPAHGPPRPPGRRPPGGGGAGPGRAGGGGGDPGGGGGGDGGQAAPPGARDPPRHRPARAEMP